MEFIKNFNYIELIRNILTVGGVITPFLLVFINRLQQKKSELEKQVSIERRGVYAQFFNVLKEMFIATKQGQVQDMDKLHKNMINFSFDAMFWGSEDTMLKLKSWRKAGKDNPNDVLRLSFEVIMSMRKDLGLNDKKLNFKDLLQLIMQDDVDLIYNK